MNPKILYGTKPLGVPEVKGRPPTTFEEFNLSYKKFKPSEGEATPGTFYNHLSSNKKRIFCGNLKTSTDRHKGITDTKSN